MEKEQQGLPPPPLGKSVSAPQDQSGLNPEKDALKAKDPNDPATKEYQVRAMYLARLGIMTGGPVPFNPNDWMQYKRPRESLEDRQTQDKIDQELALDSAYSNDTYQIEFLTVKTDKEIRDAYIKKLMNMGIMAAKPVKKQQTSRHLDDVGSIV
jgi:hypothetical protein